VHALNCRVIVHGRVYDVSEFVPLHRAAAWSMSRLAGPFSTFYGYHPLRAKCVPHPDLPFQPLCCHALVPCAQLPRTANAILSFELIILVWCPVRGRISRPFSFCASGDYRRAETRWRRPRSAIRRVGQIVLVIMLLPRADNVSGAW
jgi:hypothetical protein